MSPRTTGPGESANPPAPAAANWLLLLRPLVSVYAAALAIKNTAYSRKWLHSKRLQTPVISVGNLSVGGAGKTPLVVRLAELLVARGYAVDVLSRGYGRHSSTAELVAPDDPSAPGEGARAERYGDEPLLIARSAHVPVYVGPSRYVTGLLAEQRPAAGPRLHLLDDGFQHRQLARAVDIVVLHRSDFAAGLLPFGRLREPPSALSRASIAVLRTEDAAFESELRRYLPVGRPIWWMERSIVLPPDATARAVAFCGIAHPSDFLDALTRAGASLAATHVFPDHHAYTPSDVAALVASVPQAGAAILLTTEKDLVRLSTAHQAQLRAVGRLYAVPLQVRVFNALGTVHGAAEQALAAEQAAIDELLALAGLGSTAIVPASPRGQGGSLAVRRSWFGR